MKRSILTLIILTTVFFIYSKTIIFQDMLNSPIPNVRCVGLSQAMDSVALFVSDRRGAVAVDNPDVAHLLVSHEGYSERLLALSTLPSDTVTLVSSVTLGEVTVTPDDVEEFETHTSYRISQADFRRYSNVYQTLNVIPNLVVLSNGALFYEGSENVKLLIDGVDATRQEVQSLSKEDIAKVDVYQTPPPRFLAQGVSSVIDIRLKSKLHGGNGSLDITQAFHPLKGENSAAVFYNYRQSRFSLLYDNSNNHLRKYRQSEVLDYDFDGVRYLKTKEGLDSSNDKDNNNLNLSYQINKPDNFLYNVNVGVIGDHNRHTLNQIVRADGMEFPASNYLKTGFTRYSIGNYIEKKLGNGATLLGNVRYQHYNTSYESRYRESGGNSPELEDSHSIYSTGLNSVVSEIQYEFPRLKTGYLYLVAFENFNHSKYKDTATPFYLENNVTGGQIQWIGSKKKFQWFAVMGANWYYSASPRMERTQSLVIPAPMARITWRPTKKLWLSLEYSLSGQTPSIAQLSETNQWLDTKLVYHGNAKLSPYRSHDAAVNVVFNSKYLNFSVRGSFTSSPGMICDMYTETDSYMLQTLVNLDRYRVWLSRTDFTIKPLGNKKLTFWNRIIAADLSGKNSEYSWHGYRFQWMSMLRLNLDRWTGELYYQYPGKIVEGQLERPRAQCWSATVLYRPQSNLSFGLEWFMPFGKGMKESEHTVNSAPVYADTELIVRDRANMLSLKMSYNLSFGRNRNKAQPQYDNYSNDSGILTK